jgi:signal transduction histidine kinase/CheY-like chemotaxis protein
LNASRPRLFLFACAIVAGLFGLCRSGQAEEGRLPITVYSARDTGGKDINWTTVQDDRGVLYFGNDDVLSFDGDRWRHHPVPGSYAVRGLAVGENGRLWVGATNEIGYFDRTPQGLSAYHSLVPRLPPGVGALGEVWSVFARGHGAVFVTADSILVWDGQQFRIHSLPGARRLAAMEAGGQIYIYHPASGLLRVDADRLSPFISSATLAGAGVLWMEKSANVSLLATNKGLFRFVHGTMEPFGPEASAFIRGNVLTSACRLPNGDIALGTLNGGLVIASTAGAVERVLTTDDGLPSRSVFSLFTAEDNALWIASGTGLVRLDLSQSVSLFDAHRGLAGLPIHAIGQGGTDIFVATNEGTFRLGTDESHAGIFQPVPELAGHYSDLYGTSDGGIYAAGFKGVDYFHEQHSSRILSTSGDVFLFQRSRNDPKSFILASGFDILRLTPDEDPNAIMTLAHLNDMPVSMSEDRVGNIWVGTASRGIYRLSASTEKPVIPARVSDDFVHPGESYVSSIDGAIAAFTGHGIEIRDPNAREARPVAGSPTSAIVGISNPDAAGAVWAAFDSPFTDGIRVPVVGRLSADSSGNFHWQAFTIAGLGQIGDVQSLFVDHRGIVWLGGNDGLLRLEPRRLNPAAPPRAPLIRSAVAPGGKIAADDNTMEFDFAALNYGARAAVRFQTKLSGGTGKWSAPTASDHLTLAGLGDGRYELSVRVIDAAGFSSPAATWRFIVLPPWYRTVPARIAWALLFFAALYGAFRWRLSFLRRHNLRLEGLVQKKTAQLEKANAAKSEFLANMSHEIRNPISGILGLSLAMEETALDPRQRGLADSIRSCATLLATLVDDVLDFSKIEAGKIELRPAPFSLRACLSQCLDMVAEEARATGALLTLELPPELPDQRIGDSARVQQIILNYLTNALKFSAGRPIVVGALPARYDRLRLFVRDQGAGLTAAEIAALFTKFSRLESARAGNIRGSGLGLAVCHLLAQKMDGKVGVDSQPGLGSCFWADLPLPPATAAPAPASSPSGAVRAEPLRALIVEDIDYNAVAMQAVLRRLGIDSDVVTTGPDALAQLQHTFYDVAFMDWNLPGMIGTEVVAKFRALEPASRRTIIIATTAYSAEFNREACLQAGMDAFIAKPFTPEKISAALHDLRGSRRSAASVVVRPRAGLPEEIDGIDLKLLRLLGEETPAGLAHNIESYLATFEADRAKAHAIVVGGTASEIHRIAHRLLSHAKMVNSEPLIRLAVGLQAQAAIEPRDRLLQLLAELDREFAALSCKLASIPFSPAPA